MVVFTADEIEEIVKKIIIFKKDGKTLEELNEMDEFLDFRTSNRMFYELILSDDDVSNNPIFRQMMKMKRRLESGEDQYSVDVKFGQYMADKYINPVIKK
jgi:hypothetical protein